MRTLLLMVASVACTAGCVRVADLTLPRFEKGAGDALSVAPTSGVYEVRWSDDGEAFRTIHGSQRVVGSEQSIGFASGPDDEVIGVAGQERFELQDLPRRAKYLVWHTKVHNRTAIGSALAAPVSLASGVHAYLANLQQPDAPPGGRAPSSTDDWSSRWQQEQENARQAEKDDKRERERIRRIFGLPPKTNRDCD